jgi:imidazolonepropionase-like amidohydrolase
MKAIRWLAVAGIALVIGFTFGVPGSTASPASDRFLALVGGRVYLSPKDRPIPNGVVLIRGEKIEAVGKTGIIPIPAGSKVIDCKGLVVTAGFQNSHVHFDEPKWMDAANQTSSRISQQLADMLTRYGFTTVVDTGSMLPNTVAIRTRVEADAAVGPRILTAGAPLYPPDGIPYYLLNALPPEILKLLPQPATPEAAVKIVDDNLDGGADIVKLFTGSWVARGKVKPMPVEVAKAAVEEAHRRDRLVFTHPSNVEGLEIALNAHVDVLAHAIEDLDGWNDSYLTRMKASDMALIPTLKLFGKDSDIDKILEEVGSYERAGGQILFGTDVDYITDYDPTGEYVLMSRARLTPMQILASLTTAPAERFREGDKRGKLSAGMDADVVVLNADSLRDPTSFTKVRFTIRRGRVIYPLPSH